MPRFGHNSERPIWRAIPWPKLSDLPHRNPVFACFLGAAPHGLRWLAVYDRISEGVVDMAQRKGWKPVAFSTRWPVVESAADATRCPAGSTGCLLRGSLIEPRANGRQLITTHRAGVSGPHQRTKHQSRSLTYHCRKLTRLPQTQHAQSQKWIGQSL